MPTPVESLKPLFKKFAKEVYDDPENALEIFDDFIKWHQETTRASFRKEKESYGKTLVGMKAKAIAELPSATRGKLIRLWEADVETTDEEDVKVSLELGQYEVVYVHGGGDRLDLASEYVVEKARNKEEAHVETDLPTDYEEAFKFLKDVYKSGTKPSAAKGYHSHRR